jgi:hypothetical protein
MTNIFYIKENYFSYLTNILYINESHKKNLINFIHEAKRLDFVREKQLSSLSDDIVN